MHHRMSSLEAEPDRHKGVIHALPIGTIISRKGSGPRSINQHADGLEGDFTINDRRVNHGSLQRPCVGDD